MNKTNTDEKASSRQPVESTQDWFTQAELDGLRPVYLDMNQTAITNEGTFTYCGFNKWFRTSGPQ